MPYLAGIQLDVADAVRRDNDMRKYLVTLVFGGLAAVTKTLSASTTGVSADASPAVAIEHAQAPVSVPGLRDEAAMILVGSALIGLAAAVRRAA